MTSILQHWLRGIAAFMILLPIVSQLLSNKTYKKYIKYFTGLLFILIVIQPLTNLFSIDELLQEKLQNWNLEAQLQDIGQLDMPVQTTPEQMLNMDEGELQTWIRTVASKYEIDVENSYANLCTDSNSNDYGTITHLYIKIKNTNTKSKDNIEAFKKDLLDGLNLKTTMLKIDINPM